MRSIKRSCATIPVALFIAVFGIASPAAAQDKAKPAAASDKKAPAAAPDKAKSAPSNQKVIVENDKVKVFEVRYKPGEGGDARERPPRVVRALNGGTMQRTYPDGKTENVEWKTGDVKYFPKDKFANKNVGKGEVVLFVVETK
jgi:hypothetical protein